LSVTGPEEIFGYAVDWWPVAHFGGTWTVTGSKTWISRLNEAAVFTVFFKDPAGRLTAGVIDAADPGLERHLVLPCGLSGWAWGELRLHDVRLRPCDILGHPGEGMALLRSHFAHYRPLVAATALGVAAAVHDMVAAQLSDRWSAGLISKPRDNALIALGRAYAQINAALLATHTAQQLAESGDHRAETWGCAIKVMFGEGSRSRVADRPEPAVRDSRDPEQPVVALTGTGAGRDGPGGAVPVLGEG
jgi:alkylation response protein AidB-like acyl-CoA dehydrogenase